MVGGQLLAIRKPVPTAFPRRLSEMALHIFDKNKLYPATSVFADMLMQPMKRYDAKSESYCLTDE